MIRYILLSVLLALATRASAQVCDCGKEFLYIKDLVEKNFAGFQDRIDTLTKKGYEKKAKELFALTQHKFASDQCTLIISKYLDLFKSHHLGLFGNFDPAQTDTTFVNQRPRYTISPKKMAALQASKSWEGIYWFTYDSSYKIAVIKDLTPLHDYIGVLLESKWPTWKPGMIKFEGKLTNDSLLKGLLYIRNHRPKEEGFMLRMNNNKIGYDWQREGTAKEVFPAAQQRGGSSATIDAKRLSSGTFYIKLGSCNPVYKPLVDSILKADEHLLNTSSNLILDVRDNGGGADEVWEPLLPWLYTNPIKHAGVDARASVITIARLKKYLDDPHFPEDHKPGLRKRIEKMENAKGQWVSMEDTWIDSSFTPMMFPKKVIILINRWCGSATEELLLAAQQSSKVILVGENTVGNLDYSNTIQTPFSCYPYTLVYPSTRSRRLDMHQGIDNIGIAPKYRLAENADWIQEALKIAEKP